MKHLLLAAASLSFVIASSTSARADDATTEAPAPSDAAPAPSDAAPAPSDAAPAPEQRRFHRSFLTPRFGMMSLGGTSSSTAFAPSIGLGYAYALRRYLALSFWSDTSSLSRGTSEVTVDRVTNNLTAMLEGWLWLGEAVSLRAGLGPAVSVGGLTANVGDRDEKAWFIEPGFAWKGSLDVMFPSQRVGFTVGANGCWHASSHDVIYFAGLSFALDRGT